MTQDKNGLYQKLESELQETDWAPLEEHYQRGAIVYVDQSLDLIEVGEKIALDEVNQVKLWMKDQKLLTPDEKLTVTWKHDTEKKFRFIIISPYVLIQEMNQ